MRLEQLCPTSAVNLALTLEQPGHVASPLSACAANTQTHTQHSPTHCAGAADGHTGSLLQQSHISITLSPPSSLFSTLSVSIFLATQNAHLIPSQGLFSTFTEPPPPPHYPPLEKIKQNKMETLPLHSPTGRKGRIEK